jgi:hypothetical protein
MKPAHIVTLLASLTLATQSRAAWQRLGTVEKHPIDIASSSVAGIKVESASGVAQPENLISDDSTAASKVAAGKSEVVYSLGQQDSIDLVSFSNNGAEGKTVLSSSADGASWEKIAETVFTASDRSILMHFAHASTGFVKMEFQLAKGGSLGQLAIYGARTDADFDSKGAAVNAASGLGGTRVIYCNPTPIGGDEVAVKYNRFDFPESDEKFRTLIYDLGKPSLLTEVGSVHSPRPVRFSAYAFDKLPEKQDWRHRMSFDPTVFDTTEPVAMVEDAAGVGHTKATLAKSVVARFLALRWEPDFNPPGFSVLAVNIPVGPAGAGPAKAKGKKAPGAAGRGAAGGGGVANAGNFSSPFSISALGGGSGQPAATATNVAITAPAAPAPATVTVGVTAAKRPVKSKK